METSMSCHNVQMESVLSEKNWSGAVVIMSRKVSSIQLPDRKTYLKLVVVVLYNMQFNNCRLQQR